LFLHSDPRWQGCPFQVEAEVDYSDESMESADPDACEMSRYVLAQSRSDPRRYRRFIRNGAQMGSDYQPLPGAAFAMSCWLVYADSRRNRSIFIQDRRQA